MDDDQLTDFPVSRRRLAFRPPVQSTSSKTTISDQPSTLSSCVPSSSDSSNNQLNFQSSTGLGDSYADDATKRKASKLWTHEEIMVYYEGLKLYGKDFESVAKCLRKRKLSKDKDQVKNYFYNSLKFLKQLASIDDDELDDIPNDVKELFLILNACEWKKRLHNAKLIGKNLRELIFEGSTSVKLNRKSVILKTPFCPSLAPWFASVRKVCKFPSDVILILKPKSNGDAAYMRSNYYNPFLKIRVSTNERLSTVCELLNRKWNNKSNRSSEVSIRLWPSYSTDIGRLKVIESDVSQNTTISLNQLKNEMSKSKKTPNENKKLESGIHHSDFNITTRPTFDVVYPKAFSLFDSTIKSGLTVDNVENAIVAELYCVCGLKEEIELRYQIDFIGEKPGMEEPWRIMLELLHREYGEALCSKGREECEGKRKDKDLVEDKESSLEAQDVIPIFDEASNENPETTEKHQMVIEKSPQIVPSKVVQRENDEFEQQVLMLRKMKSLDALKLNKGKRKLLTSPSFKAGDKQTKIDEHYFLRPNSHIFAQNSQCQNTNRTKPENLQQLISNNTIAGENHQGKVLETPPIQKEESSNSTSNDTTRAKRMLDFSQMFEQQNSNHKKTTEMKNKRINDILSTLGTPQKTPKKLTAESLFGGDISLSPFNSKKSNLAEAKCDEK